MVFRTRPATMSRTFKLNSLLSVPHLNRLHALHLLLQLQDTVQKRLSRWRTSWNVDIDRNNTIAASHHRVWVVIVATAVCARAHRDDPSWLGHLIVDFTQGRCHLIGECARNNDHISLTRRRSENDTITIHVVARCSDVHHFDGTAGKTECQRPNWALTAPVQDIVETCDCPFAPVGLFPKNLDTVVKGWVKIFWFVIVSQSVTLFTIRTLSPAASRADHSRRLASSSVHASVAVHSPPELPPSSAAANCCDLRASSPRLMRCGSSRERLSAMSEVN